MSVVYSVSAIGSITNAPGTGGGSFVVTAGQGARFGSPTALQPRFMRVYEIATGLTEKVLCSARSTDTFTIVTRNYDGTGALNIQATGYILEDIDDFGPWKQPNPSASFDPSFYGATGGGTVTVGSADQLALDFWRFGYGLLVNWVVSNIDVAGTVTELRIAIPTLAAPGGIRSRTGGIPCSLLDSGSNVVSIAYALATEQFIRITKTTGAAFTAGSNTITTSGQLWVPVN